MKCPRCEKRMILTENKQYDGGIIISTGKKEFYVRKIWKCTNCIKPPRIEPYGDIV